MEPLTVAECRVLGCLIEKQATLPDTYPMTLNALRGACNQKSSREPVVAFTESDVVEAVDGLRDKRLSRLVHQPGGRSAKHRQRADEELGLDEPSLAVLSILLLRGPQTVRELRTRSERQFSFGSVDEVGHVLERLSSRDEPLVQVLPRHAGQKDRRWVHLLAADLELPEPQPDAHPRAARPATDDLADRVARLEALVGSLCEQLGIDPDLLDPDLLDPDLLDPDLPGDGDAG